MYSTLNLNTSHEDLIHLSLFLLLPGSTWESLSYDSMSSVIDRVTRFKSFESVISDLQSIGLLNDSNTNSDYFLRLLMILSYADKHGMLIDAYHHMVKSHGFVIVVN